MGGVIRPHNQIGGNCLLAAITAQKKKQPRMPVRGSSSLTGRAVRYSRDVREADLYHARPQDTGNPNAATFTSSSRRRVECVGEERHRRQIAVGASDVWGETMSQSWPVP